MNEAARRWKLRAVAAVLVVGLGLAGAPTPSGAQEPDPEATPSTTEVPPTTATTTAPTTTAPTTAVPTTPTPPPTDAPTDGPDTTATTAPPTTTTDGTASVPRPIDDEADAPLAPDDTGVALALAPAADLLDGTAVTVTVTGATPDDFVELAQCPADVDDRYEDCDVHDAAYEVVDASGSATVTMRVDALLSPGWEDTSNEQPTDCRLAGACVVAVVSEEGAVLARTPLPFVADGALAPPPTIAVEPATDLAHEQTVAVTATGLVWSSYAVVVQCTATPTSTSDCDDEAATWIEPDAAGAVATETTVAAVIETSNGAVDCRQQAACALVVHHGDMRVPGKWVAAPLAFDPATEVVLPTLTVTPATDLVDGQNVLATGTGFRPGWSMIWQCPSAPTAGECQQADAYGQPDASGRFAVDVKLRAILTTQAGEVDCRTSATPCVLVASASSPTSLYAGSAELHFDPDGPVAPPPTIEVGPDDLADEATVTVTGANFDVEAENADLEVCETGSSDRCDQQAASMAPIDNDGSFTTELGVAATFPSWDGDVVDCRTAPGCEVVARSGYRGRRATAALSFAPAQPADDRYLDAVFDEVEVTRGIVYRNTTDAAGAGVALALDIYEPAGDTEERRPVVVWLGGSWFARQDRAGMATYAEAFARRGYVAVTMDYRLRPGLRCCPTDDVEGVTAAVTDATADVAAGVQWLREHGAEHRIDPEAIAVGGHQGGAAAAFGLAHGVGRAGGAGTIAAALPIAGVDLGRADAGEAPFLAFHDRNDRTAPAHLSEWACTRARPTGTPCGTVAYGAQWGGDLTSSRQRDIVRRSSDFLAEVVLDPLGYVDWTGPRTPTGPGGPDSPGGPGDPGHPDGGHVIVPLPLPTPTLRASTSAAAVVVTAQARGTLPRTGADLARLAAIAAALAVVGGTFMVARRRRLTAGDAGGVRVVAPAVVVAVVLLAAGFAVTTGMSPTSSSDQADDAPVDHSGHDMDGDEEDDHNRDRHVGEDDHDGDEHDRHGDRDLASGPHRDGHDDDHDDDHDGARHAPAAGDGHGHPAASPAGHPHGATGPVDGTGAHGGEHQPGPGPVTPGHGHPTDPAPPTHPGDPHHPDPEVPADPEDPHHPEPEVPDDGFDPDWTPDQVTYAQALVDGTEEQLARYANPGVLPLLGYQWILDGKATGEYQHWIHLPRIVDQRTLDPAYPESLVFRNAPQGPVLEAAMYMLNINYNMANIPADIAWLPGWHVHENLCFVGNFELVGVTVDGRCLRGRLQPTPPMLHVWAVDTRCGRFAGVDENGLQCHHEH